MSKCPNILQWNCRGIGANFNDLKLLLSKGVQVACLQETRLPPNTKFSVKHFSTYNFNPNSLSDSLPTPGGITILVHTSIPHSIVPITSNLQVQAVRISLNYTLTICNIYVPPSSVLDEQSLTSLLQQLPPPFILMGDFNAHHPLWGSSKLNLRGQVVENVLLHNNISILNSKQSTYIHPATGSLSNIDLTLCSPSIAIDFSWNLQSDTYGSDHFPILLSTNKPTSCQYLQYWKINKADWPKFSQSCEHSIDNNILTIETLRHAAFGTCYIKYKGKIPVNLLSSSE